MSYIKLQFYNESKKEEEKITKPKMNDSHKSGSNQDSLQKAFKKLNLPNFNLCIP